MPGPLRLVPDSVAVLITVVLCAVLCRAEFTFQTTPASGDIVTTADGLNVRWEVRAGNSPDSNSMAPDLVAVSLGYKDASGNPKVLFPPISGLDGSTVPLQGRQFTWAKIDFTVFTGNNEDIPPLGVKSQFFISISDQATGYRSSGQIFAIVDSKSVTMPGPGLPPASVPGNPPSSSAVSPSVPTATEPVSPTTTGTTEAVSTAEPVTLTAVPTGDRQNTPTASVKTTEMTEPTGKSGKSSPPQPSRTSPNGTTQPAMRTPGRVDSISSVATSIPTDHGGKSGGHPTTVPRATAATSSAAGETTPKARPPRLSTARPADASSNPSNEVATRTSAKSPSGTPPATSSTVSASAGVNAVVSASTTDTTVAVDDSETSPVIGDQLQGSGSPAARTPSLSALLVVVSLAVPWW